MKYKTGAATIRAAICSAILLLLTQQAAAGQADLFDPRRPLAAELEMSLPNGFTLATVGDCIISRPLSQKTATDSAFAGAVELLRGADVAFGNLETSILDVRHFDGHPNVGADDWGLSSLPAVAADLRNMGFDIMGRANNHSLDWGVAGMRETTRWLDEAGLVHAGVGENRGLARAPHYFESPLGRIALISLASTYAPSAAATPSTGTTAGRPGLNGLRVERVTRVTARTMQHLVAADQTMRAARGEPIESEAALPEHFTFLGTNFELGDTHDYDYRMNELDLAEILRNIRLAKQHADFVVVSIHAHERAYDEDSPAGFLKVLAYRAIDAGADTFVTHGIHHLGPIEVYAGKPIFYGLANFFWSDVQEPLDPVLYEAHAARIAEAFEDPAAVTDADLTALMNASSFATERTFQTVIAISEFEDGRVSEIRLHPIDLGYGRRLPDSGVPRLADREQSRAILERLQVVSENYGTRIAIERDIGVIRP